MARKGSKLSEETKQKMREAMLGRKQSEEHKTKKAEANRGSKRSEESKKKMSIAKKGRPSKNKGKSPSKEARIKMSLAKGGVGNIEDKTPGYVRYPNLLAWRNRNVERTPYCQFCFSEDNLHAHHIIQKAKFPQYHDEDWNCRILCNDCHKICHKQGGY